MSSYLDLIEQTRTTVGAKQEWSAINAEYAVRCRHYAPRYGQL